MPWNPSSVSDRRNKNDLLWNDMEKAYDFIEKWEWLTGWAKI